jgi:NAD(P)H-hydrate epimerase
MKIAFAQEMRMIDKAAIELYGIPEIVLMENAGYETAVAVEKMLGDLSGKKVCVLAGTGNNGGDAFAAVRHMANRGAKIKVFLMGEAGHLTSSARINFNVVVNMGITVHSVVLQRDWDKAQVALGFSDVVIDGLLGTGYKGQLRENMEKMIDLVNDAKKPVVAIDLPSGVNADTGAVFSRAVNAQRTISFGLPKMGQLFYPGAKYVGELLIDDIGIPGELLEDRKIQQELIDFKYAKKNFVKRAPDVHKGNCGKVLVIAGSRGLTGAAALSSMAALRSGTGVVTLAIAESLHNIMECKLTEVMTRPVPEVENGIMGETALPVLLELAKQYDTVVIGPGLGRHESTMKLVREFVAQAECPIVVDADAIYAYCNEDGDLKKTKKILVLTPHMGEMARFLQVSVSELKESLVESTCKAARKYHAVFVLKSEKTIVVYPNGSVFVTTRGNSGMATAGSGDVLAGTIGGLIAQGFGDKGAVAGVFLHGFAGDIAAKNGMNGLIASDIITALPAARFAIGE